MKKLLLSTSMALALLAGCSDDDASAPATPADTGTVVADTGTAGGDTGTMGTDSGGETAAPLPTGQIDRMGRPAINTALVTAALKDDYNKLATFGGATAPFETSFNDSLKFIDMLDGTADWTLTAGTHPLRGALLGDYLVVDTGKACPDKGSYLDVELFVLGLRATANTTCGGRTLNDDVIDTTLTALVTALKSPVKDNVDAATKPATATFPYLADPN